MPDHIRDVHVTSEALKAQLPDMDTKMVVTGAELKLLGRKSKWGQFKAMWK